MRRENRPFSFSPSLSLSKNLNFLSCTELLGRVRTAYGTYHVCVAIYFSDKYAPTNRQFAYSDSMIIVLRASILCNETSQSHFFVLPSFPTYTLAPPGKKNRWASSIAAHFTRKHAPPPLLPLLRRRYLCSI